MTQVFEFEDPKSDQNEMLIQIQFKDMGQWI